MAGYIGCEKFGLGSDLCQKCKTATFTDQAEMDCGQPQLSASQL